MKPELQLRQKPHFLRKKHQAEHKFYRSKKILGTLFDQVQLVDFVPQYRNRFDPRILNAYEANAAHLTAAKELKVLYDSELRRLMAKHDIRTEFEAWSVFVLSHNLEARDYTFPEEFGRTMGMLKARHQEACCEAVGAKSRHEFKELAPFVAAMYTVTAAEVEDAVEERQRLGGEMTPKDMPLMSFPWLFVDELGKIGTGEKDDGAAGVSVDAVPRRSKKAIYAALDDASGDIETAQGITHLGEVLKLDFGQGGRVDAGSDLGR